MVAMQGGFNAHQYEPKQGGGVHPIGRFPAKVSMTEIKSNKEQNGGYFQVDFETPAGTIPMRYNLWNQGDNSAKVIEIAQGQLAALCHATGRYQLNWPDEGAALRGAQLMIEVGFQKGHEPSQEKPNGGYTEVRKVLDTAGNEPGKSGAATQQQPNQQQSNNSAPMTNQGGGNWGNNQQQVQNNTGQATEQNQQQQSNQQQGWGNQQQSNPQQNNAGGAWQPGGNNGGTAANAPWGRR